MTIIESKTLDLIEEILESNVECNLHVEARELRDSILQINNLANLEMIFIEPSYFYPVIFKGQTNYKFIQMK